MNIRTVPFDARLAIAAMGLLGLAVPASAISLAGMDAPAPSVDVVPASLATESWAVGSATLIPVMAADLQARGMMTVDAPAAGASPVGKPVDDIQFVKQATEGGRKEVASARDALRQLRKPELKRIAEMLVSDHSDANSRLSQIAETKGWPVPAPQPQAAPAAGTATPDFDSKWTAEMIAGHERSVALYRAQAQKGEDRDLRKYAAETLPTIEHHLAQLKSLQK